MHPGNRQLTVDKRFSSLSLLSKGFYGFSNLIKGLTLGGQQVHRYKQIEYKAGATIEVIKCIPRGCRKGADRGLGRKKTPEEMREANLRQAARKLARKINANFRPGDWHITLTYKRENRPEPKEAQKVVAKLLDNLRREFKARGFTLKYVLVTEYKQKAIHHHMVINQVNDGKATTIGIVRKNWKDRGHIQAVPLYEDGEYQTLAEYLVKETEKTFRDPEAPFKQRYSCSRNLITPKPECRNRTAKKGWKLDPKPRAGYYIIRESLYNGFDRLGYPYQRYVMVKIHPTDADWEPAG